nr:penicillin acylase family protein [Lelliottia steviae]
MFKIIKWLLMSLLVVALLATGLIYGALNLSLPALDGKGKSTAIEQSVKIERDVLGQAVIHAQSRLDAAYALGFAHGQDRFFQMDLLRRNAAGELSELFGKAALELDKTMRFHQLRKRSQILLEQLPSSDRALLATYAKGVNEGHAQTGFDSFEYLLTAATAKPWQSEDSLLTIFSMYLDLQTATFERDKTLIQIEQLFGKEMVAFITQPSLYQAALDNSQLAPYNHSIPSLSAPLSMITHIEDTKELGSNNWAVTGDLTQTGAGMLSDDMHLSFAVPIIWYRAQLNYPLNGQMQQITGVSLPGAPAIVVGTNNKVAWGFTNGYLDTADWIALDGRDKTWQIDEAILLNDGSSENYTLTMSEYGPVKNINGKPFALSWVAHHDYAVNMDLIKLEQANNVDDALALAADVGIPVQNLMVVDDSGSAAWKNMGAIPARKVPNELAVSEQNYPVGWHENETERPYVKDPASGRLWTGNSRVVSAEDNKRFGNGAYAMGARSAQIRDRLFEKQQFTESDFYQLQHDNEARFLTKWHNLLVKQLESRPNEYKASLTELNNWQACACADSIGYTLVKYYRDEVINGLFSPLENELQTYDGSLKHVKRDLEPAVWQLINTQPKGWLNPDYADWSEQMRAAFDRALDKLTTQYGQNMQNWQWGSVNKLVIEHPFAKQIPILKKLLNMPAAPGFGDTFMPAVQGRSFGASQRFIVQPGHLDKAIMAIPGGQSGHPLSEFYRAGFDDYVNEGLTPLMPQSIMHSITIDAVN